jgi:hypothetical protein
VIVDLVVRTGGTKVSALWSNDEVVHGVLVELFARAREEGGKNEEEEQNGKEEENGKEGEKESVDQLWKKVC